MHVVKKQCMYVSKPFGGEGGGGLQHAHYITPAFSGVPNKGDKIRIGCLTPAFSGAQTWAEMLHHPAFSGIPDKKEKKSTKKNKKTKNFLSIVSLILPWVLQMAPTGDGTHGLSVTEVPLYPLGYGHL